MPRSPVLEHLAQLVAHQVDDGLEVQLGGQALLDAVDDLQLGHAFLLGLEEPGVLQGGAQGGGDGGEQAQLGLAEGVLALKVLDLTGRRGRGRR